MNEISIENFISCKKFKDSRNEKKFYELSNSIIENKSPEIYGNSKSSGEGKKNETNA